MTKEKKEGRFSKYAKFSSLGVQMAAIIAFFTWLGTFLDERMKTNTPWWTIGLSLFGVTAALYLVIKEVIAFSKENEEE
jgi:ATP synthase protein I